MVKDVNEQQINSQKITDDFIAGKNVEIHDVMIAVKRPKQVFSFLWKYVIKRLICIKN